MEHPGLIRLYAALAGGAVKRDHPAHEYFQNRYEVARERIARILRDGQARGEVRRELDPDAGPGPRAAATITLPGSGGAPSQAESEILTLMNAGVTSVVNLNNCFNTGYYTRAAGSEAYYPEWLVSTYGNDDCDPGAYENAPDQRQHAFGTSFWNRFLAEPEMPIYRAINSVDPNYKPSS